MSNRSEAWKALEAAKQKVHAAAADNKIRIPQDHLGLLYRAVVLLTKVQARLRKP